jgi:hypothetical protein
MRRDALGLAATVGLLGAAPALAEECLSGGMPLPFPTLTLAQELEFPTWSGPPLFRQPFATSTVDQLGIFESGCGTDCVVSTYLGAAECGDLAANPIDDEASVSILGFGNVPDAFADVHAVLRPEDAKWSLLAQSFVSPDLAPAFGQTLVSAQVRVGTREVFDVASDETTPQPLQIRLLADSGDLGIDRCMGSIFPRIPSHTLSFRVRDHAAPAAPILRVNRSYAQFFSIDETFDLLVNPDTVLFVDLLLKVGAQATSPNADLLGNTCLGGISTADFSEGPEPAAEGQGVQVFLSPAPSLAVVPRSGLAYEPVPEAEAETGALAAASALAWRARRRRRAG